MTVKEQADFIDVAIEDKFIIRFNRTEEVKDGQYAYVCKGNMKDLERMQEHINHVFPTPTTKS